MLKHDGDTKPLKCRLEAHHREDLAAGHLRGLFLRRGNVSDEGKSMEREECSPVFSRACLSLMRKAVDPWSMGAANQFGGWGRLSRYTRSGSINGMSILESLDLNPLS